MSRNTKKTPFMQRFFSILMVIILLGGALASVVTLFIYMYQ